ncbi:MAG: AMP-binding protein [Clostridiales bacterium]|nr:AMP-binding protein [Clostridiales bacterium]
MVRNVQELLENSAEKYPDKIAFKDKNNLVTYSELMIRAQSIGTFLSKRRVYNRPVIVLTDRNVESIVMFFGVIYSGNFYVPVDVNQPSERIKAISVILDPEMIIGRRENISIFKLFENTSSCIYEDIIEFESDVFLLHNIRKKIIDTDPLCCIFTSGSTGVPKGVLKSHRSIICMAENFTEKFSFSSQDVFSNQSPFDFDVSNKNIYISIRNGSTVDIISKEAFILPEKLIDYLNENRISVAIWASSALCIISDLNAMKKTQPAYLKKVLFSGEVIPIRVLNYWKEKMPNTLFVNLYGPTEMTGNATYYEVSDSLNEDILPIGKAMPDTKILLIDDDNKIINTYNKKGEICIGGNCLSMCYYNDAQRTSELFIQNPLNSTYPEIIYRTGDIGYINGNNDYVYVGRRDLQIKHMGYRIELTEIEAAVNSLNFISVCCCVYDEKNKKIVLFYESTNECKTELINGLIERLPKYMMPNKIIRLKKLPLNSHDKVDRVKLKESL